MPAMTDRILAGVRVLDFTRVLSGPHCTRMLCDLGADVVKVEPPGGDITRFFGRRVHSLSPYYSQQNCGKRNLSVDLSKPEGMALCRLLALAADVVVENFRPGVMERFGLGYEQLAPDHPRLVYGSITGYGQEGEWSKRRAYANIVASSTGMLDRQARHDGHPPTALQMSYGDTYASLELLSGILAALYHRERTGQGQRVDVAMFDTLLSVDDVAPMELWAERHLPLDLGRVFETTDGHVLVSADPVMLWRGYVRAMERPELMEDPRFATPEARAENEPAMTAEIVGWARTLSSAELEARLDAAGLAAGRVYTTNEGLKLARQVRADVIVDVDDRGGGTVPLINSPLRFSQTPAGVRGVAAWRGEHNREVLTEWMSAGDGEMAAWEEAGVISSRIPAR